MTDADRAGAVTRVEFETSDREAAADAVESALGFRARFTGRDVGFRQQTVFGRDVSFTELQFGARLRTEVEPNPSVLVSEVPRGGYLLQRGRDVIELSHGGLFLRPIGSPMRVELDHTVARTYNLGSVEQLRRVAMQTSDEGSELDLSRLRPVSSTAERYLRDTLALYRRHFLSDAAVDTGLAADESARHLLVTALAVFGLVTPQRDAALASVAVSRVRDHVAEHPDEALTVADLARAARTGVRSLQVAFKRELGMTPMEYVRDVRLAAARTDLLAGVDPRSGLPVTVAGVASRWGFLHPGRFSSLYFRRFGEYPSDTLRRG